MSTLSVDELCTKLYPFMCKNAITYYNRRADCSFSDLLSVQYLGLCELVEKLKLSASHKVYNTAFLMVSLKNLVVNHIKRNKVSIRDYELLWDTDKPVSNSFEVCESHLEVEFFLKEISKNIKNSSELCKLFLLLAEFHNLITLQDPLLIYLLERETTLPVREKMGRDKLIATYFSIQKNRTVTVEEITKKIKKLQKITYEIAEKGVKNGQ